MKIAALLKQYSGVDYHRLLIPFRYFPKKDGDQVRLIYSNFVLMTQFFQDVDIVVFSRECPFKLEDIIEAREKYKFKLVVDVDDFWNLPVTHYLYDSWNSNKTSFSIRKSMIAADLVTTTHERLRDRIKVYNPNVEILPNAFPYGEGQFTDDKEILSKHTLIYAGGPSHLMDLKSIERALGLCRQNRKIKEYFDFILAGYNGSNQESKELWERIKRVASIFGDVQVKSSIVLENYMKHYSFGSVSLAPLESTEFNSYKSNLKILEAGCKGLPIIVSDVYPYNIDKNEGIIVCKNQRQWHEAIESLCDGSLSSLGQSLYKYVREKYDLNIVNQKRYDLYKNLA